MVRGEFDAPYILRTVTDKNILFAHSGECGREGDLVLTALVRNDDISCLLIWICLLLDTVIFVIGGIAISGCT